MLKRHLDGVLRFVKHPITNGVAEGLNSKIMGIKRNAGGFRNPAIKGPTTHDARRLDRGDIGSKGEPFARSRSDTGTTTPGYWNRNGQVVVKRTDRPGNDHNQRLYVLECSRCGHRYGANGSDIWQRKCPECGGGQPGLTFE